MKQQYNLSVHNGSTGTKLARTVVEFPSMEILKPHLKIVLSILLVATLLELKGWTR